MATPAAETIRYNNNYTLIKNRDYKIFIMLIICLIINLISPRAGHVICVIGGVFLLFYIFVIIILIIKSICLYLLV